MRRQHPLHWPPGWKRTQSPVWSRFKTNPEKAVKNMLAEIERLGGRDVVISSNAQYRADGMPYARQGYIGDTGVAVYFRRKGRDVVFACDTYGSIHENIHAIGLTIEALRAIERHGLDMRALERAQGLAMMLGSAALAMAMGPDEDMTRPMMEAVEVTVCETCCMRPTCVAEIAEQAIQSTARPEPAEVAPSSGSPATAVAGD